MTQVVKANQLNKDASYKNAYEQYIKLTEENKQIINRLIERLIAEQS